MIPSCCTFAASLWFSFIVWCLAQRNTLRFPILMTLTVCFIGCWQLHCSRPQPSSFSAVDYCYIVFAVAYGSHYCCILQSLADLYCASFLCWYHPVIDYIFSAVLNIIWLYLRMCTLHVFSIDYTYWTTVTGYVLFILVIWSILSIHVGISALHYAACTFHIFWYCPGYFN